MKPTVHHRPARGQAAVPVLMISGALLVSGLLFYFVTYRGQERDPAPPDAADGVADTDPAAAGPSPGDPVVVGELPPPRGSTAETIPAEPAPPDPAAVAARDQPGVDSAGQGPVSAQTFRQPEPLAAALRDALVAEDAGTLAGMLGLTPAPGVDSAPVPPSGEPRTSGPDQADPAPDQPATVIGEWLRNLSAAGWEFDALELVGRQGNQMRFRLPARQSESAAGDQRVGHLEFELQRQPNLTWRLGGLAVDPALEGGALAEALQALAAAGPATSHSEGDAGLGEGIASPAPPTAGGGPAVVRVLSDQPDALQVARRFVLSLLGQDYETARQLVATERVPAERLAGLCIVFEEGNYREVPGQLVATALDGERAWIVAKVRSEAAEVETELGIEMELLPGAEGVSEWQVSGLNLSNLLARYTSGSEGIPYVPIVEHPAGGESLVLFFDFDDADLHERAQRQLDIVARLLKADDTKTIRISGHTDARGTEDYNHRLSVNRAERVRAELLNLGVPVAQIKTEGFGQERPLSPNVTPDGEDNPVGRARNRRAEIYLDF